MPLKPMYMFISSILVLGEMLEKCGMIFVIRSLQTNMFFPNIMLSLGSQFVKISIIRFLRVVTSGCVVIGYQHFGGPFCLHLY
jgi:hypothetical protein